MEAIESEGINELEDIVSHHFERVHPWSTAIAVTPHIKSENAIRGA